MVEAGGYRGGAYYHTGIVIAGKTKKVPGVGWGSGRPELKDRAADGKRDLGDVQVDELTKGGGWWWW